MIENLEDWKKAGEITANALRHGKSIIHPGAKLLDVASSIEQFIIDQGGFPAFPVNISINNIAAHYSPTIKDELVFTENDVIKLDVGARYKSSLGDSAITIDLSGKHKRLVEAVEASLEEALKIAKPGTKTSQIGDAIESTLKKFKVRPIKNLGGHELKTNSLHGGTFIPNFKDHSSTVLKEGQILAIEPFAAKKSFYIKDKGAPQIFAFTDPQCVYESYVTKEFFEIVDKFKHYPFSLRWISDKLPVDSWLPVIQEMEKKRLIQIYRPLVSEKKDIVVQAEHTVIVGDQPMVLTR